MLWKKAAAAMTTVAILSTTVFPQVAFAQENSRQQSLVGLGDSITFGWNLGDNQAPSPYAFPYALGKMLNDSVTDLGVPGWTSSDLLNALKSSSQYQSAVQNANVITLDIGNNDLLTLAKDDGLLSSSNPSLTPGQLQAFQQALVNMGSNLGQIMGVIRQLNPTATIALYNMYDPFAPTLPQHNIAEPLIQNGDKIIASVANAYQIPVVDAYSAYNGLQTVFVRPGDVHPTVAGQQALAAVGLVDILSQQFQFHSFFPGLKN